MAKKTTGNKNMENDLFMVNDNIWVLREAHLLLGENVRKFMVIGILHDRFVKRCSPLASLQTNCGWIVLRFNFYDNTPFLIPIGKDKSKNSFLRT
jgi:hypothetical protein